MAFRHFEYWEHLNLIITRRFVFAKIISILWNYAERFRIIVLFLILYVQRENEIIEPKYVIIITFIS